MRCSALRGAVLALAFLSLPMLGCEIRTIQIQLPGFADGTIEGIRLYKQVPDTNGDGKPDWSFACQITFEDLRYTQQGETLFYVQNCIDERPGQGLVLPAEVQRLPGDPTTIIVELYYMRYEAAGLYTATAFNDYGESAPSPSSVQL
ncbi:MAG: hypothetical protein OZ948_11960 [Deltaproteobacteria bacterium]|nr:hypothetical protein [Deltaproteobacteria bacterium]